MSRPVELLVLSDSHGRAANILRAVEQINFRPAAILFLGDGLRDLRVLEEHEAYRDIPVHAVAGNCDSFFSFTGGEPTCRLVPMRGHRIFMTHGHLYGVRGGIGAAAANAREQGADILLYGHTHVADEQWRTYESAKETDAAQGCERLLIANPGSIGEPRDGGGFRFGVLTLTERDVLFSHGTLT